MKRFSERIGVVDSVGFLQTEDMNNALRNSLWNYLHSLFKGNTDDWVALAKAVARFFRKVPVDELQGHNCQSWVKAYFFSLKWYEVYELIEFVVDTPRS